MRNWNVEVCSILSSAELLFHKFAGVYVPYSGLRVKIASGVALPRFQSTMPKVNNRS